MTLKAGTGAEVFYCQLANSNTEVQLTKETSNVITAATPVMLRTPSTSDVVKLYATTESAAVSVAYNALTGVGTTGAKAAGADIDTDNVQDDRWYDLQGNRINKPTRKGLYIRNGKKVTIK